MASHIRLAGPLAPLVAVSVLAAARGAPFVESDVAVRMRDGVVLRADVWRPAQDGRYPTLVYRTPYDRRRALEASPLFRRAVERGYAVVAQDVRGRYGSEGEFEPYRSEGRDGYDTIEWAAAQPWSNGAVGTFGLSYPGAVQWLAAVESPPHLEAMAPAMTFSTPENFFYAGGAFDLSWIDWIWLNIAPDTRARKGLPGARTPREAQAGWDRLGPELRGRLPLGALAELREVAPYYFEWLAHPPGDPWWEWSELRGKYGRVKAAVLNLSGWHDEAYGPEGALTNHLGLLAARAGQADARSALVLGPWVHGGVESDRAGERVFGEAARLDYPELVLRFMDRHVRKLDVHTGKPVRAFVMGENAWREADSWPLPGTQTLQLYLAPGGGLSLAPPADAEASSVLVSDPARPLVDPYSHVLGAHDYRELARRPDVLVFETPPLAEDLRVVGTIQAEVFLASDAPDADLWVKLLDVAPDGTALNLMSPGLELQRAGFREGGPQRKPLRPAEVVVLRFPRLMTGTLFPRGHRIRVVLSGSFMPHFSRNLQTGESEATSSTTRAATLRIHHDAAHPSRLALPVVADAPLSGFTPAAARRAARAGARMIAGVARDLSQVRTALSGPACDRELPRRLANPGGAAYTRISLGGGFLMSPGRPAAARRAVLGRWSVPLLGVLFVSGFVSQRLAPGRVERRPADAQAEDDDKYRKPITGLDYVRETRVEIHPSPSLVAPGFDSERVWSGLDDWEPAIAADPNSTYVYQVTTRLSSGRATIWFRRSGDGGATWEPDYKPLPDNKHQADPQIEVDGNGTVFLMFLHLDNTALMKSSDRGATWTEPVHLPLGPVPYVDHELLAVSNDGRDVYVAFNAGHSYVSTSHDGGASFALPVKTNSDFRQWFHTAAVVAPTGEVYFAVQDYAQSYLHEVHVKLLKSVDAGLSWQTHRVDVSQQAPNCQWANGCYTGFLGPTAGLARDAGGALVMVYNSNNAPGANNRIWLRTSLDGVTWSQRQQLSASNPAATNAFPLVVAGRQPGDLRVVWQGGPSNAWNTWYRRSTDGGLSWGPILRLSDLGSGAPYKRPAGYFFPYGDYYEIAVDGDDVNHLIWGEGRNYIGPGGSWYTRGL